MERPIETESARPRIRAWELVAALLLLVTLGVVVHQRSEPPAPLGADEPAASFSAARALAIADRLLADDTTPHPVATAANEAVSERLVAELEQVGIKAEVHTSFSCGDTTGVCAQVHNVMAQLPGRTKGPALLLTSNYDSPTTGPGAAAIASTATMVEVASILSHESPHRNPVVLLFCDGTQAGQLGASAYAAEHMLINRVTPVVLEAGSHGTRGLSWITGTTPGNAWLIDLYARSVKRPAASSAVQSALYRQRGPSTLGYFWGQNMVGLSLTSMNMPPGSGGAPDRLASMDPGSLQHHGESFLSMARALAEAEQVADVPLGNAVYSDILGFTLVRWPEQRSIPLALVVVVLVGIAIAGTVRRRHATANGIGVGAFALLFCLSLALLMAHFNLGMQPNEQTLTGASPPRIALWIAIAALCAASATLLRGHSGVWDQALALWLVWALLGLVTALKWPGMSIMFVAPGLVTGLFAAVSGWLKPRLVSAVVIAGGLLAGAIWWPQLGLLEHSAPLPDPARAAVPVLLLALGLTPLLAGIPVGSKRLLWPVILGTTSLAMTLVAALLPLGSDQPSQVPTILHVQDSETGEARWVIPMPLDRVPEPLIESASLTSIQADQVLPWATAGQRYAAGPAPASNSPPASIKLIPIEIENARRRFALGVLPPQGARTLRVLAPERGMRLAEIFGCKVRLLGETATAPLLALPGHWNRYNGLEYRGIPEDGLRMVLTLRSAGPNELVIVEVREGLPDSAAPLLAARASAMEQQQAQDRSLVINRVWLD